MEPRTESGSRGQTGEDSSTTKNIFQATTRPANSVQDDGASETSPLLSQGRGRPDDAGGPLPRQKKVRSARTIMLLMLLVITFTTFGDQVKESPETRVLESVICYRYYEENDASKIKLSRSEVGPGAIGGVDEMYCKADDVQDELAMLLGYQNFFDGFPYLVLALPFGWAADRYGRWPFLFLNLVQFALRAAWAQIVTWNWQLFDVRMVWLASSLSVLGGGSPIASSLFFTVIADITPSDERAANFLRAGAANLSAYLLMPPVAAALMQYNPWIPYLMSTMFNILSAIIYLFTPETLDYRTDSSQEEDEEREIAPPDLGVTGNAVPVSFASRWYATIKSNTAFITKDWRVPALISTFIGHILIADIGRLLLQYCSKRYALKFSEATLLLTIRNGVNVLLLFVILPYLAKTVMLRLGMCSQLKDLYLARTSQALSALGWLLVALAPGIPVVIIGLVLTSLGTGAALLIRSFLTSIIESHNTGKAYSIISLVDTLGMMFGAPLLAGLFADGLASGGAWIGLPFFSVALLASFFAGVLFVVRLRKDEGGPVEAEE